MQSDAVPSKINGTTNTASNKVLEIVSDSLRQLARGVASQEKMRETDERFILWVWLESSLQFSLCWLRNWMFSTDTESWWCALERIPAGAASCPCWQCFWETRGGTRAKSAPSGGLATDNQEMGILQVFWLLFQTLNLTQFCMPQSGSTLQGDGFGSCLLQDAISLLPCLIHLPSCRQSVGSYFSPWLWFLVITKIWQGSEHTHCSLGILLDAR